MPARLTVIFGRFTVPCAAMPAITAMITHAIVSSKIAVASINWPRSRRIAPTSIRTIATILTDEIESAVPRNSAVTSLAPGFGIKFSGRT